MSRAKALKEAEVEACIAREREESTIDRFRPAGRGHPFAACYKPRGIVTRKEA